MSRLNVYKFFIYDKYYFTLTISLTSVVISRIFCYILSICAILRKYFNDDCVTFGVILHTYKLVKLLNRNTIENY